jgi:arsenical pump membrane protein
VTNAASFVLPISNPANLVVFTELPALGAWLAAFALPSVAAVACTFAVLRFVYRTPLREPIPPGDARTTLSRTGIAAALAVGVSALLIVLAAAFGWPVGRTTFILGACALLALSVLDADSPRAVLREAPWSIVPLVGGLFVIVAALDRSGVLEIARGFFRVAGAMRPAAGSLAAGAAVSVADNVLNNLPVGVLTRYSLHSTPVPPHVLHAALVGVDLGPNLSVTGSLATLLWLLTLRRENVSVTPWDFFKLGLPVTLPALLLALLSVR